MMSNTFAMCATWGPEQTLLYNEAYATVLSMRHPWALGQPIHEVWPDVWADIAPSVQRVLAGEALRFDSQRLVMTRHGYPEETYWTYSYSPLREGEVVQGLLNVTTEVTALVLAQRRAEANAQRVQLALEAGAITGTWVWHLPTDRFTVDAAFARSFGLDPELGHDGLSLEQVIATVHPDDRAGLIAAIDDVVGRGGPYAHQYRVRRADGRYYWIEANGRVELGPDGKGLSFPGVLIDVDGRRAVEAERDQAIARLRALNAELEQKVIAQSLARGRTWQLSPDLLCVVNAKGVVEASNPAWEAMLGWSEEEVARAKFFARVHPDDLPATRAAWDDTLGRGLPVLRLENRYQHKAGDWRWLSWVAVADETKVYCSARDITDEKMRQADLVTRTAERDRLWENTNDLMGTAGFDGYLKAVNPAWTALLGWTEAELMRKSLHSIVAPDIPLETCDVLPRVSAGEEVTGFVAQAVCSDGSRRSLTWTATPDRNSDLFLLVGRDMTALHEVEATLRQSQKMEAVGQLTGGLAHDFNNLLAGVSGALELMSVRVRQGRLNEVEKYLVVAQGAAKRAAVLTHRLLAFSRRQTLEPKPTNVNHVVQGMLDMIQRTVGPGVLVEHFASLDVWTAMVDVSQLENALLNLCLNARDAMPTGGRITIQTQNQTLDRAQARALDLPEGPYLSLSVSDTGTGMTPDVIAKAFDPFFTTKPLGQGTGLGLSMIYGFAKQSGGQVRIVSTAGKGAQVCIYLPRHTGQVQTDADGTVRALTDASGLGETVLVVDDEPTVRMLVVDVLEELGYTALQAGDAMTGLKVLESDVRIDLLVSDVGLPGGMNGRQMADVARAHRPNLQVLFITGYAENAFADGQLAAGMSVLAKPFSMDALATRVRELIAR
ncbi:PAS domain-containing protein [Achromobacter sp. GG226]|nr:PAS domain-containing protein [Verticiella sp. GG226]